MDAGGSGGRVPPRESGGGRAADVGARFQGGAAKYFDQAEQERQEGQDRGGGDQRAGSDRGDEVTELPFHKGSVRNAPAIGLHANEKSL